MGFFNDLFASFGTAFKAFAGDPEQARVLATGKSAIAKITNLGESGAGYMTINDQPLVVIELEVYPEGEASFPASIRTIISRLATSQFQPGAMVRVKYDPADKTKVYFDTSESASTKPVIGNVDDKFEAGQSGFAEILGIEKADGKKDGNQLYKLTVEVTGTDVEKYSYSKEVPLPEYSLPFFQIGKKYKCTIDKNDKTKVSMDMT